MSSSNKSLFGFIFGYDDGELSDSEMVRGSDVGGIDNSCRNSDNLAVRSSDGSFFQFHAGAEKGDGEYVSRDGEVVSEWDLYDHMADEDNSRYNVMYGIEEDDNGNMTIVK